MTPIRLFTAIAAALGALGVAAGAFGAHGLESQVDPERLEVWHKAARYQMYHAVALLALAALAGQWSADPSALRFAGWSFVVGVAVFSGSLYLLVLTDTSWLGAVTPLGGVALIVGWSALLKAAI